MCCCVLQCVVVRRTCELALTIGNQISAYCANMYVRLGIHINPAYQTNCSQPTLPNAIPCHLHTFTRIHKRTHKHTYTYTYIHTRTSMNKSMHMHVCLYIHTYIHTYIHMHIVYRYKPNLFRSVNGYAYAFVHA